jgi:Cdc6-like AAA superfamily ATPase
MILELSSAARADRGVASPRLWQEALQGRAVFVFGNSATGKTSVVRAVVDQLVGRGSASRVAYLNATEVIHGTAIDRAIDARCPLHDALPSCPIAGLLRLPKETL